MFCCLPPKFSSYKVTLPPWALKPGIYPLIVPATPGSNVLIPIFTTALVRLTISVTTNPSFQNELVAPPIKIVLFGLNPWASTVVIVADPVVLV